VCDFLLALYNVVSNYWFDEWNDDLEDSVGIKCYRCKDSVHDIRADYALIFVMLNLKGA